MTFAITFYNNGSSDLNLEVEIRLESRGDDFLVDCSDAYWTEEMIADEEDYFSHPIPFNPLFEFQIYAYNDLTQNYEAPINEDLTAEENFQIQEELYEAWISRSEANHEARYDR